MFVLFSGGSKIFSQIKLQTRVIIEQGALDVNSPRSRTIKSPLALVCNEFVFLIKNTPLQAHNDFASKTCLPKAGKPRFNASFAGLKTTGLFHDPLGSKFREKRFRFAIATTFFIPIPHSNEFDSVLKRKKPTAEL